VSARWLPIATLVASLGLLLMESRPLFAASVVAASVARGDDGFEIHFSVDIDASLDDVRDLIGDIRNLAKLSPSTVSSETLLPGVSFNNDTTPWVHVVLRPCVLVFCKTLTKVSREISITDDLTRYEVIESHSSFKVADEELQLERAAQTTRMSYRAHLVPDFFVPPVIGAWLVRRVIVAEMTEAAKRAEIMLATSAALRPN